MIEVLRLDHRSRRDARLSTHVALISRALGASAVFYGGEADAKLEASIGGINRKWGCKFKITHVEDVGKLILSKKKSKFKIAHLTMYGMPLAKKIKCLRSAKKLLLVVGGAKVPAWLYDEADFNIAVSNQPHSEAGALAIVLHELAKGVYPAFKGKLKIVPQEKGKKIVDKRI